MTPLCQHQMPTGKTCQSPALTGQPLCFHHDREAAQAQFILALPALTDRSSILQALSQVVVAIGFNQISTGRGNLLLRSMNLATRLISAIEKETKTAAIAPKPQPPAKPTAIQAAAEHRSPKLQHQHHSNDRLPRSMREKIEAIRRANTRS
jgi:hypothetical protein